VIAVLLVLLRGAGTAGAALALGGIAYALLVQRARPDPDEQRRRRTLTAVAAGAALGALAQGASLGLVLAALADDGHWAPTLARALGTGWLVAAVVRIGLFGLALLVAVRLRRARATGARWSILAITVVGATAVGAWASHAAARLTGREWSMALDAVHQVAVALWVGGLVHLLVAWPPATVELRRFSTLALPVVALLAATGVGLGLTHVDGLGALGTAYGAMLATKTLLFAGLVAIAALNRAAVRRLPAAAPAPPVALRRFVEVEAGVALTLVFVAASLSSAPPAADVVADRATPAEIAARLTPRWPRLTTPTFAELAQTGALDDRTAPRTDADRAWSEFNHNVAGLFVLATGVLAALDHLGRIAWARGWPLLFIGFSAFIVLRSDPEYWPHGDAPLRVAIGDPEVIQHWLLGLVPAVFGVCEWLHRRGRLPPRPWAYMFPLLSAVGGGLLLSHAHALTDVKEAFLMELTHLPLGVLGIVMGWARWLELRLPPPNGRGPGRVWAPALVLVGLLLLLYRER
jgi:copper resistance protein D